MKRSISRQMAAMFIGLMAIVLVVNLLINNFFLENYYVLKLQRTLLDTYTLIDTHISEDGEVDEEYFVTEFAEVCNSNNINVVVLDESNQGILRTQGSDSIREKSISVMKGRLQGY